MVQITSLAQLRELIPDPGPKASAKLRDQLCDQGRAFIVRSPFLAIATNGSWGLEISQKGDEAGFIDDRTLLIPERNGNGIALGLGNILADPRVGLMLIRPATDEILRISGRATLLDDAEICARLSARGKPAVLAIRIDIDRAAFHCVRSARRAGLWQPETWDAPGKISFGKIYADALALPDIREAFDQMAEEHDRHL
jgi:predicted pyridoxine 5'-phosphate oxidase superfamily flavin-nucleotide-binding protein